MPTYEYRCENGHTFEVVQSMSDDPVETCEECGAPVERVFHPIAVHFKGSGFYSTDYAGKGKDGAAKEAAGKDGVAKDGDSKSSAESKGSGSGSGDSKSEKTAKTGSGSDSD